MEEQFGSDSTLFYCDTETASFIIACTKSIPPFHSSSIQIVKLFFVTQLQRSALLHRSVAVCLQSSKNNLWSNLWAGHQPNLPESFRFIAFSDLLHGEGAVAWVIGVVRGLGGNKSQADTYGLPGRGGGRGSGSIIPAFPYLLSEFYFVVTMCYYFKE